MQMLTMGMSFKTSPVSVREKIAFSGDEIENSLLKLSFYDGIKELVILSTCNRTEFYIITSDLDLARESLISFIEKEKNLAFSEIEDSVYSYYNKFAAEHLYHVVSGIDSLILGEGEILAQVKNSFTRAMEAGTSGKILNSLFKFAIEAGKRVRTETTISQRPTSTGAVVTKLTKETFDNLNAKTVLLVGAGKISHITAKNLKAHGIGEFLIINRTFERATELAEELGGTAVKYEFLDETLHKADIVVVCTGAPEYLVTCNNYVPDRPVLLVDLSIPRNIEPELSGNSLIKLYDIDSLENVASVNKEERKEIITQVEEIIKEEMNKFVEWFNALEISPAISSLSMFFDEIRSNEVSKANKKYKLNDREKDIVDVITKSIIQKILHYPVTNIRVVEDKKRQLQYVKDLMYLFQLDAEDVYQKFFRKKEIVHKTAAVSENKIEKSRCPFAHTR